MGSRYLTDLADVLRAAGLDVIEMDGWKNRARGSGGYDSGRPNHIMVHHTASGASSDGWPDANYCTLNDDDAPLCNLYLNRAGSVWVCAAGATNTNGSGTDPCGVTNKDSMNSSAIGVEAGNVGTGAEVWPAPQMDAYLVVCRALGGAYGIPDSRIHGHVEYSPGRKIDPAGPDRYATGSASWNMGQFRADASGASVPTPVPPNSDLEDEDMAKELLLQAKDGAMAGALAVAPADMSRMFYLSTGEDYQALLASGQYVAISLSGSSFERIPGAEQIDVVG